MFKLSLTILAGLAGAATPSLATYCNTVVAQCGSVFGPSFTNDTCVAGLAGIDLGTDTDVNTNSIGCRARFLLNASAPENCRYAGPTGGGRCGSVLQSTCKVATTVCASQAPVNTSYTTYDLCLAGLAPYVAQWGSKQGPAASVQDSLECRVYHALVSFTDPSGNGQHCTHFGATGGPCSTAIAVTTDAAHYCDTLGVACTGAAAQFGSTEQCVAVAKNYNNTNPDARNNGENSLGCRQYHAEAAQATGDKSHCGHAGPTGGGVCGGLGGELLSWGAMLNAPPCADDSVKQFIAAINNTGIINNAIPSGYVDGTATAPSYSYSTAPGSNTQACRVYHLSVATGDSTHCAHGNLGGGMQCGAKLEENLCTVLKEVCGFGGNASYQFATEALCKSELIAANLTVGTSKPQATADNTYACRFYHAGVAATYKTGAAKASMAGAEEERRTHCSHTLKAPKAGCPAMAGGNTGAPTASTKKSGASAFSLLASGVAVGLSVFLL